jgi:putative ABC transport system permease protein
MIKNYFKIACRNLWKNKTFSLINIIGLSSGLACFILIALYVADELSYDRYNKKASRIFRINSDIIFGGNKLHMAVSADPMGAALKADYPQVEAYVRFFDPGAVRRIKKENEYIREPNTVNADSSLFNVFTLPAIAGDTKSALNEPNTVVITETIANKYFNTTNVIGKFLSTGNSDQDLYKITAVITDVPKNSHFNFELIFSMKNVEYQWGNFISNNFHTYLLLKNSSDYKIIQNQFPAFVNKHLLPQAKQFMNLNSMEDFEKAGNKLSYSLMPLTDIHLRSDRTSEMGVNGSIQYVYIFSVVALFVLLLAGINFMNLSTARSSGRAKEVGIRKVLGTNRKALIGQFLTESTAMSFISLLLAIGFVWLSLAYFNNLSGKQLTMQTLLQPKYLTFLLLLPFATGILSGIYPAFFLSSFKPITVLKGKLNAGSNKSILRNTLVVFQFSATIILITATIIVYRQLNFIQTKKLGFDRSQTLVVRGTNALENNKEAFKQEVAKISGITNVTNAGFLPVGNSSRSDNSFSKESVMDAKNGFNMQVWDIDDRYIDFMGMEMVTGRNFSKEFATDSGSIIINEAAAKTLGFDNPLGKKIHTFFGLDKGAERVTYNIIGVVKNFHIESLRENVGPLCLKYGKSDWAVAFKVNTADIKSLVNNVENKWNSMAPGQPFVYNFLDESFDDMYRVEQRTGKLGLTFAIIAILIACLGLFGLAIYMAEQRVKEIGVRKVLGATVGNIAAMLSKDFLKLVLLSTVLALPVAWWVMNKWLQDFAFRVDLSWWIFVLAGIIALLIALLTVSAQAIKAASANPVKSLRAE